MRYYAAPMEGITGYIYRNTHHECFGGCDRYYMPFIDPKDQASLMRKEKKDIAPDNNRGIPVIPQILTNRADKFLTTVNMLADLGYTEANLNLGCPSGTVVSRGKGSGFLAYPDRLREFFDAVFDKIPLRISVKTRLGMEDPEEIMALMEIYNDYPISEVILHARVREDYYKRPVRPEAFGQALAISRHPVCYNGDLYSPEDVRMVEDRFPHICAVMLGRGLIANPQLAACVRDGQAEDKEKWFAFMRILCDRYQEAIGNNALFKMKEIWTHMIMHFPHAGAAGKKLLKAKSLADYRFRLERLAEEYHKEYQRGS